MLSPVFYCVRAPEVVFILVCPDGPQVEVKSGLLGSILNHLSDGTALDGTQGPVVTAIHPDNIIVENVSLYNENGILRPKLINNLYFYKDKECHVLTFCNVLLSLILCPPWKKCGHIVLVMSF